MIYVKVSTDALIDGKFLAVGPDGFTMYMKGLMYSKQQLTDGFVPEEAIQLLGIGVKDLTATVAALCAGSKPLWVKTEGGYTVGEEKWAKYQTTKDQVEKDQEASRERQALARQRKKELNNVTQVSQRDTPPCHAIVTSTESESESESEYRDKEQEKKEAKASKEKPPASDSVPVDLFELLDSGFRTSDAREAWDRWLAYRRARKLSAYTHIGFKQTASKLRATFSDSGGRADPKALIEGINHSMANNWAGIFKPKDDHPIRSQTSRRESPMEVAHGAAQILAEQRETARNSS